MTLHRIAAVAAVLSAAGCTAPVPRQQAWNVEPLWRVDRGAPVPDGRGAYALGRVQQGEGRWREAAQSYRRALEESPKSAEYLAAWQHAIAMAQEPAPAPMAAAQAAAPAAFRVVSAPTVPALRQVEGPPAAVPATADAPLPATAASLAGLRIEVFNGNGIPGAAARVRLQLREQGIAVGRLGNLRPYGTETTTVYYRPGCAPQARWLASRLPTSSALVPGAAGRQAPDLRIVVGRDLSAAS